MNASAPEKFPWYFKNSVIVIALLSVGPLALPLIWLHPKMSSTKKMLWTAVVLVLSYFLYLVTVDAMKKFGDTYRQLKEAGF